MWVFNISFYPLCWYRSIQFQFFFFRNCARFVASVIVQIECIGIGGNRDDKYDLVCKRRFSFVSYRMQSVVSLIYRKERNFIRYRRVTIIFYRFPYTFFLIIRIGVYRFYGKSSILKKFPRSGFSVICS